MTNDLLQQLCTVTGMGTILNYKERDTIKCGIVTSLNTKYLVLTAPEGSIIVSWENVYKSNFDYYVALFKRRQSLCTRA